MTRTGSLEHGSLGGQARTIKLAHVSNDGHDEGSIAASEPAVPHDQPGIPRADDRLTARAEDQQTGRPDGVTTDQSMIDDAERLLDDVDDALTRLESGSFGTCQACGQPISEERLLEHPTVRSCGQHPQLTDPGYT